MNNLNNNLNKILMASILAIILSVSVTSISAQSSDDPLKLKEKIKSLEKKIKELVAENGKLKTENNKLKTENDKLKTNNTKSKIENKPQSTKYGTFSNTKCMRENQFVPEMVTMTGKYTNGGTAHNTIFFRFSSFG